MKGAAKKADRDAGLHNAGLVDDKNAAKKEPEKPVSSQESTTIRVGIEKVDQLINLIGELVITQAMASTATLFAMTTMLTAASVMNSEIR